MKKSQEAIVYKLHKALYGLTQAPIAWKLRIDSFFMLQGFRKCEMKYGVYVHHRSNSNIILVCLYVGNILLIGSCSYEIAKSNKVLMNEFDMIDLGNMIYFLGMKSMYSNKGSILHQVKYELELLKEFKLQVCNHTR